MLYNRYKGVLLYGPPGTGKTSLASSCAHDAGASLFCINGPQIISQYYGESEQALHEVFVSARRATPAVVGLLLLSLQCCLVFLFVLLVHKFADIFFKPLLSALLVFDIMCGHER